MICTQFSQPGFIMRRPQQMDGMGGTEGEQTMLWAFLVGRSSYSSLPSVTWTSEKTSMSPSSWRTFRIGLR